MPGFREHSDLILAEIGRALAAVDDEQVRILIDAILGSEKVFVVGVGRVLLCLQAFVKRLNHLGIGAWFVGEINEPAIGPRDLLIVGSGSGESVVTLAIARIARQHGARIAHIGSNPQSSMKPLADNFLRIPVSTRLELPGEIPSRQIMTSLFEQCLLILGDAIALEIAERRQVGDIHSLRRFHANLE